MTENEFPEAYVWRLQKSDGYMDLKMLDKARSELRHIPPPYREHRLYRASSLRLAMEDEDWGPAAELARGLRDEDPREPAYWIQLAYATRRHRSLGEALLILRDALERFPEEPIVSFNLACYECQLGHRQEALSHLRRAETLAPVCRHMALEDEDLQPLWPELESS